MESPLEHLIAAIELAEEAERDENGFLTEESQEAVKAAYGSAQEATSEKSVPSVKPSPFRRKPQA